MPCRTDPERGLRKVLWGDRLEDGAEEETGTGAGAGEECPEWAAESCGERSELISISAAGRMRLGRGQLSTTLVTTEWEGYHKAQGARCAVRESGIRARPRDT